MRHQKNTKKFKRTEEERRRLWTDLSSGLIKSGKIETYTTRGKWFTRKFERMVTHVKKAGEDTSLAFRRVRPYFSEADSRKLIEEIVPKLKERNGGYTRIIKLDKDFNTHDKSIVLIVE
jgi:large subunit ribosomal protein L17